MNVVNFVENLDFTKTQFLYIFLQSARIAVDVRIHRRFTGRQLFFLRPTQRKTATLLGTPSTLNFEGRGCHPSPSDRDSRGPPVQVRTSTSSAQHQQYHQRPTCVGEDFCDIPSSALIVWILDGFLWDLGLRSIRSLTAKLNNSIETYDEYSEPKIHVRPHTRCVALSGSHMVVGHQHHIKIYDLADVPRFNLDTRDMGIKDAKVTYIQSRRCGYRLPHLHHAVDTPLPTFTIVNASPWPPVSLSTRLMNPHFYTIVDAILVAPPLSLAVDTTLPHLRRRCHWCRHALWPPVLSMHWHFPCPLPLPTIRRRGRLRGLLP